MNIKICDRCGKKLNNTIYTINIQKQTGIFGIQFSNIHCFKNEYCDECYKEIKKVIEGK